MPGVRGKASHDQLSLDCAVCVCQQHYDRAGRAARQTDDEQEWKQANERRVSGFAGERNKSASTAGGLIAGTRLRYTERYSGWRLDDCSSEQCGEPAAAASHQRPRPRSRRLQIARLDLQTGHRSRGIRWRAPTSS